MTGLKGEFFFNIKLYHKLINSTLDIHFLRTLADPRGAKMAVAPTKAIGSFDPLKGQNFGRFFKYTLFLQFFLDFPPPKCWFGARQKLVLDPPMYAYSFVVQIKFNLEQSVTRVTMAP